MKEIPQMSDLNAADNQFVCVEIRHDSKVLWISVDGVTVCRISDIPEIVIIDHRQQLK